MSLFGTRRGRTGRGATLRLAQGPPTELRAVLGDRRVLARLGMALVTIAALVVCVQAWKHAFPFRLDQRPVDGVAAVVDFKRVNAERTARARDRAAEQVPPVFTHNPRAIVRAPQELSAALLTFVMPGDVASLPPETRRAFGLAIEANQPPSGGVPAGDRNEAFQKLKEVASSEQRLRDAVADFAKFLQPVEKTGLVRPEHITPELSGSGQLSVAEPDDTLRTVNLSEVQLPQLLAPTGSLHGRWALFPNLLPIRSELENWLKFQSPETLFYDDKGTQEARLSAGADPANIVHDFYNAGNVLVKPGEAIDETRLDLLQAEYDELDSRVSTTERLARVGIVFAMFLVLAVLFGYYLVRNEPALVWDARRLSLYLGMFVLAVGLERALSFDPWRADVGPVLACVMVCAVVFNQMLATLTAFALALIVTVSTGADLGRFTVLMSVCATAAILLRSVPSRSTLVVVGLWSAVVYFLIYWGTTVVENQGIVSRPNARGMPLWLDASYWIGSLRGAGWCVAAGFLISGSLPFIESTFGAVTDISLLELGDVSHPLLQELVRRAPGTYNHSITVASIGETAADAIGANGLLVRVGAYFHDIGKMLKPHYFVENASAGENRHDHLAPAMSTLIIIGHVKDGADLAHEHNLPRPVIDFIEQHHGTTLVEYFYHEAARQAEVQPDHRTDADESHFRYPGPKPQTRETAVLMIADAVEGASRALSEPTPSRIERLVHEIALRRLLDGQFDECGLTITELSRIEMSLTKSLTAMYHGRVKYPEPRTA
jgi:putative nucleotidyltransferase with HDIG domain